LPLRGGGKRAFSAVQTTDSGLYDSFAQKKMGRGLTSCYDGHVHTRASDGWLSPDRLAFHAYSHEMRIVVCDHYTLQGAIEARAELSKLNETFGMRTGAEIICGIEFSVDTGREIRPLRKMHLLGVGIDPGSRPLARWLGSFKRSREGDIDHALKVKSEMEDMGFIFDASTGKRLFVFRNVYRALIRSIDWDINCRQIKRHLGISVYERRGRSRSKRKRRLTTMLVTALRKRFGDFKSSKPCLAEAVEMIRRARGATVMPHPLTTHRGLARVCDRDALRFLQRIASYGIDAVEAFHPAHAIERADRLSKLALRADLAATAGSDAHTGPQMIGRFMRGAPPAAKPIQGKLQGLLFRQGQNLPSHGLIPLPTLCTAPKSHF